MHILTHSSIKESQASPPDTKKMSDVTMLKYSVQLYLQCRTVRGNTVRSVVDWDWDWDWDSWEQ